MATASPNAMASAPFRRTSERQLRRPAPRTIATRSEAQAAPAPALYQGNPQPAQYKPKPQHTQYEDESSDDGSSDDEIIRPMKLSALTKALLNDGGKPEEAQDIPTQRRAPTTYFRTRRQANAAASVPAVSGPAAATRRSTRIGSSQATEARSSRTPSPAQEPSPVRRRVVRLSNTPQSLTQLGSSVTARRVPYGSQAPAPESVNQSSSTTTRRVPYGSQAAAPESVNQQGSSTATRRVPYGSQAQVASSRLGPGSRESSVERVPVGFYSQVSSSRPGLGSRQNSVERVPYSSQAQVSSARPGPGSRESSVERVPVGFYSQVSSSRPGLGSRQNSVERVPYSSQAQVSSSRLGPGSRESSVERVPVGFYSQVSASRSGPVSCQNSVERVPVEEKEPEADVITPAQKRVVRIPTGSSGNRSRVGTSGPSSGRMNYDHSVMDRSAVEAEIEHAEAPDTAARNAPVGSGSASRYLVTRNREENPSLQSSMRVKRVGKLSGSFLSGPARRGRRRQSEEEAGFGEMGSQEPESQAPEHQPQQSTSYSLFNSGSTVSGSPVRATHRQKHTKVEAWQNEPKVEARRLGTKVKARQIETKVEARQIEPKVEEIEPKVEAHEIEPKVEARQIETKVEVRVDSAKASPQPHENQEVPEPATSKIGDIGHLLSVGHLQMPSTNKNENDGPFQQKWAKSSIGADKQALRPPTRMDIAIDKALASPERKPLAAKSHNTNAHQAAPAPPPKMSVLEAATATAGAAAAGAAANATMQTKQRRNILKVNNKIYTRLDCIGRGGSAKVYQVMAENGKLLALKRVSLENAEASAINGYLGEIDLLKKLNGVDRVVNLYDSEMNHDKQMLSLVMEMGEKAFDKILMAQQAAEKAKFDPVSVRFYWKEMVECVQSVHNHNIVHSDLKPANFVLVQGRLKLIDFGIANAIRTDETVNVHRENQIGTPNFMSPESLLDFNARDPRVLGQPKLMKLGKPSDVWSLGCILYQMVYGFPPFARIPNHMARCQAIVNWDHEIDFATHGLGGLPVPPSLIRTMKRCLTRDEHLRPTCEELLHFSDPFLYPAELNEKVLPIDQDLLGRIIHSVFSRCRESMPAELDLINDWPSAYWGSLRKTIAGKS